MHNQVKSPWFLELNPNGRIPTITHEGFPVFETSAIILYIAAQFDKEHKFSKDPVKDPQGYSQELQWLFFQSSGQGPYYGQAAWFTWYHPEKIPSAVERYKNEIKRVLGVLNAVLEKQEWLVGGKCTVADLSFIS